MIASLSSVSFCCNSNNNNNGDNYDCCYNNVTDEVKNDSTTAAVSEKCVGRKSNKRKRHDADGGEEVVSLSRSERDSLLNLFDGLCDFLRQSLSRYMQHVYASHVLRDVIQALSAQPVDDVIVHSRRRGTRQHSHSTTGLCSLTHSFRIYSLHMFFLHACDVTSWLVVDVALGLLATSAAGPLSLHETDTLLWTASEAV